MIAEMVVKMYIPKVFPPILESLEVSRRFDIPEIKETNINGTATSFSILTNIVPKGIIQSETKSFKPIKTEMIPKTKPISNPKIIFECKAIT